VIDLIILGAITIGYAVVAAKLDRLSIGAPVVFTTCGVLIGPSLLASTTASLHGESVKLLTEITLALLLFVDASTIALAELKRNAGLPMRLLGIGFPLTILAGVIAGRVLLPAVGWASAALIASILAPTDAALSLAVVTNPQVPPGIRQVLNVESGLNDGIATPIVTVLIAVVAAEEGATRGWVVDAVKEIGVALAVATLLGIGVGWLAAFAHRRGLTSELSEQLMILTLALVSYGAAVRFGGNGFVAAFVTGVLFGAMTRHRLRNAAGFTETSGLFLSFAVWTLFGVSLAGPVLRGPWHPAPILYAVASLTVVRMVPVAIALAGTGLNRVSVFFIGWFGPRGLASIVFLLLAAHQLHITSLHGAASQAVVWTILISVLAHGFTATPGANWYARRGASSQDGKSDTSMGPVPVRRKLGIVAPPQPAMVDSSNSEKEIG